jgi:L-lactate permease
MARCSKLLTSFIIFGALMFLAWAQIAQAESTQLTWSGLPAVIGKNVRIVMPDGSVIEGLATAVEPEALVLQVRKTNRGSNYAKGSLPVPRASLKTLQVADSRIAGRVIGVTFGAALGVAAGLGAAITASGQGFLGPSEPKKGRAAGFAVVAVALPVGGYFLGKKVDTQWKTIAIAP